MDTEKEGVQLTEIKQEGHGTEQGFWVTGTRQGDG